jgi:tetratricopeptide (TPR) repeat protein
MERPYSHQLEEESRRAFVNLLPSAWIVRPKDPDYGIDMEVEIVEGERVTNNVLWVQIKATGSLEQTQRKISYPMKTRHLKHYEGCRLPVIILFWIKSANAFYYLFAQRFIKEELSREDPNWRAQETKTIEFPSDSKLENADALESIATDGYLYIAQQQLSANSSVIYWLDGIPKSDDAELKEGMLKALSFMIKEKHHDAIAELEHILKVCTVSPTQRMSILLNLGNVCYSLSQYDRALTSYAAILELTRKVREKDALYGKSAALGNIGLIYRAKGDLDNALKHMKEALKIDQKIGNKREEAGGLGNIGMFYSAKGDLDNALKYLTQALQIHRAIGDMQGEASDIGNIGAILAEKGDLDNALKHMKEALKIFQETGYKEGEANELGNIGAILRAKGDLDNSLKHHQEALKIDQKIGYREGEAIDVGNIGLVFRAKGDLDNSLKHHQEALKISQEIGYRQGEARALINIGMIFGDRGDLDNALKYLTQALQISREISDRQGEAGALCHIGLVFGDKGDFDNSLEHLTQALQISQEIGYRQGEARALANFGLVFRAKGDLDNSLKHHQEALKIFQKIGYKEDEVKQLGHIGLVFKTKGDLDNALKYLTQALQIIDKFNLVGHDIFRNEIDAITKSARRQ